MAQGNTYEVSDMVMPVIPSMKDFFKSIESQASGAGDKISKNLSQKVRTGLKDVGTSFGKSFGSSIGDKIFSKKQASNLSANLKSAFGTASRGVASTLSSGMASAGNVLKSSLLSSARVFSSTIKVGINAAGSALAIALGAVATQVAAGGLTRALGINEAQAKLQALGYSANQMNEIMAAAKNSIDGTSYAFNEAITASTQFLAAGIKPGKDLQEILQATGKLADISGRSFNEMGSILSKDASAGIVQWEDLIQLIDAGIPIQSYLAKSMGKTVAQIRKMASAGKISFTDLNKAIQNISFDSVVYASKNITLTFKNVKAQLSKIGANLWTPILEGLSPVLTNIRTGLIALQKSTIFNDWVNLIQTHLAKGLSVVSKYVKSFVDALEKSDKPLKNIQNAFRNFKNSIKGLEGPLGALGIVFGSKLLSQIPIIGGLFSGLTIPMGLLAGAFRQMFKDSAPLQKAISNLGDTFNNLITGDYGIQFQGLAKKFGDGLADVVNMISDTIKKIDFKKIVSGFISIGETIGTFVKGIIKGLSDPSTIKVISDTINNITDTLSNAFGDPKSLEDVGKGFSQVLVSVFQGIGAAINIIVPIIASMVSTAASIASSDTFKGIIDWIVNAAKAVAGNKALLFGLAATLSALFIAGKLSKPIMGIVKTVGVIGAISGKANIFGSLLGVFGGKGGDFAGALGELFEGLAKALGAGAKALVGALPDILLGILAISAIIASIALIFKLFKLAGFDQDLKDMVQFFLDIGKQIVQAVADSFDILVKGVNNVLPELKAIGQAILSVILPIIDTLGGIFVSALQALAPVLVAIIQLVGDSIKTVGDIIKSSLATLADLPGKIADAVSTLLKALADNGAAAGVGAAAAAVGISAFAASLVELGAGSAISGLGQMLGSIASGIGDVFGSMASALSTSIDTSTATNTAMSVIDTLGNVLDTLKSIPQVLIDFASMGLNAGISLTQGIADGITSNQQVIINSMVAAVSAAIAAAQSKLNSANLSVNISTPTISGAGSTSNVYNNNRNISITTQNSSVLKSMVLASR